MNGLSFKCIFHWYNFHQVLYNSLEVANGSGRFGLGHGSNGLWVKWVMGQMGHALRMG